jgi:SAM-dependent methyltransferase
MFSSDEIHRLYYEKVKLPESYFHKYVDLPACPAKAYGYNWGNNDFPRNWCILDFIEWTVKHKIVIDHLGYTCDSDPELEFIEPARKTKLDYPPYDLHTVGEHFKNEFDFFLFNQTIEHLYNPFEAVKQIYETMKPGGYVFTSVPTLNIPHMTPIHFNGFTPMGLAMLFKTSGFEVVEIGQWGNYDYIQQLWKCHVWPGYESLNDCNFVANEEECMSVLDIGAEAGIRPVYPNIIYAQIIYGQCLFTQSPHLLPSSENRHTSLFICMKTPTSNMTLKEMPSAAAKCYCV